MALNRLQVTGFRCFDAVEFEPAPGINLVTGKNASGKTSLLEAIFLLGRGRSFRTVSRERMIREGAEQLRTVGRLQDGRFLGFELSRAGWLARAGGEPVGQLSDLSRWLAVQVMDPEIHRLVQEGPGERRRYLDWATFHVKPGFLEAWRNYQRALRQRNAALKSGQRDSGVEVWERVLAEEGARLDEMRGEILGLLQGPVNEVAEALLGAHVVLEYRPGQAAGIGLADALAQSRGRDRRVGMTQVGPHRADVLVRLDDHKVRGWVSRGQQKLVAAAMLLGQARLLAPAWGDRGVLLVDDPAAELDRGRCESLLRLIAASECQVFVTALEAGAVEALDAARRFHVEQGRVLQVV